MRAYTQLTQEQRYQIHVLLKTGHNQTEIAHALEVHKSTISREIGRNRGLRGYRPKQAQEKTMVQRKEKVRTRIPLSTRVLVEDRIRNDWSPEQISDRLFMERGIRVSHEWIYRHVYRDKQQGGDLHKHLRCRKKYRKLYGHRDRRGRIPNRVGLDQRPAIVDRKSRIGDWEGDTIIGKKHCGAVASLVERKSKYTVLAVPKTKHARLVRKSIEQALSPFKNQVHTITCDNGLEFAQHQTMAQNLATKIYFANPYASWERGLNENTNGLIRQYFPKGKTMANITQRDCDKVAKKLNTRPRRVLGVRTPEECYAAA